MEPDPKLTAHRAQDLIRLVLAIKRDAVVAGPGTAAWERWQTQAPGLLCRALTLLGEATGVEVRG